MGRRVLKFDGAFGPEGCGIALRAMSFILPPSARRFRGWWWRPKGAIFKGRASPPFNLPTPIQGVGGERSETEGGGCIYGFVVPFFAAGCSLI